MECSVASNSIRTISRINDVLINTLTKLHIDIGTACQTYHNELVVNVWSERINCDEFRSFIYGKDINLPANLNDIKLAASCLVGNPYVEFAKIFIENLVKGWKNCVLIHKSLRVTPAMEGGLTNHLWSNEDLEKICEGKF